MNIPILTALELSVENHIARVRLNRPDKANAMSREVWSELRIAFDWIDATPAARVAILCGGGAHFTSGIDLAMLAGVADEVDDNCEGRKREKLRRAILDLQDTLTSLERCRKPVIAAIHGACIGGGIDLICCADMRYCSGDAFFSIKEIDMGMTADVGTLQRLPRLIGDGMARACLYGTQVRRRRGEGDRPGQPRFRYPRRAAGRGHGNCRRDRRQVTVGYSRYQGNDRLRA